MRHRAAPATPDDSASANTTCPKQERLDARRTPRFLFAHALMFNLDREEYFSLRVAAKLVPSGRNPGKPIHVSTLFRWAKKGVRGKRLATYLIGADRYTTRADLDRFLAELNEGSPPPVLVTSRDPVRDRRTKRILNRERLSAGIPGTDSVPS